VFFTVGKLKKIEGPVFQRQRLMRSSIYSQAVRGASAPFELKHHVLRQKGTLSAQSRPCRVDRRRLALNIEIQTHRQVGVGYQRGLQHPLNGIPEPESS
jgi:hypothetical protein